MGEASKAADAGFESEMKGRDRVERGKRPWHGWRMVIAVTLQ